MKNFDLEHFGVVEMNQQEMKQTDGGFPALIALFIGLMAGLVAGDYIEDGEFDGYGLNDPE